LVKRAKVWLLALAGIVLPVALVFSVLIISNGVSATGNVPGLDAPRQPSAASTADGSGRRDGSPSPRATASSSVDDHSGRCSEPEHLSDPTCTSGTSGTSGSGDSGSGGDD
jgi:hypothetical protein